MSKEGSKPTTWEDIFPEEVTNPSDSKKDWKSRLFIYCDFLIIAKFKNKPEKKKFLEMSSDSSSEEEDVPQFSKNATADFFKTLTALKNKDPRYVPIYILVILTVF